jgi:hypothetical protein
MLEAVTLDQLRTFVTIVDEGSFSVAGRPSSTTGTAATDVWAVGKAGKRLHFEGTGWTAVP